MFDILEAMLPFIDDFLNKTTMYRVVLYYLTLLIIVALICSLFGVIPFSPINLIFSLVTVLMVCWGMNTLLSRVVGVPTNIESVYITAFILTLIISPVAPTDLNGIGLLVFASAWAMASKYLIAPKRKHVFNPAAFGIALTALLGIGTASWWVGWNVPLLPVVLLGGLLIVRKLRRLDLVASFSIVALTGILLAAKTTNFLMPISQTLLYSSFVFLALVMLTEPMTTPPTRKLRMLYGAFVGLLYAPLIHLDVLSFSPELALLTGNLFAFAVNRTGRYSLTLKAKNKLSTNVHEFIFTPDRPLAFRAGQYLEWTLPHISPDTRGNRRYFTIASSPTESEVRLGVKFYEPPSTFKKGLASLEVGEKLFATQLDGDFVLPNDKTKKLVFIAGGIGITPFRSMVRYLVDTGEQRSVTLLYANTNDSEAAYRDLFDQAASSIGMKTVYVSAVDKVLIEREVPIYRDRMFYISGPPGMVDAYKKLLRDMGVRRANIKTDYFPGLA